MKTDSWVGRITRLDRLNGNTTHFEALKAFEGLDMVTCGGNQEENKHF